MTVFPAHDSLSTSFILLVLNTGMTTGSHPNDLAKLQITIDSWNKALFRLPCMMLLEDVDKQFGTKNSYKKVSIVIRIYSDYWSTAAARTDNMNLYPVIIHEGDLSPSYSGSDIDVICNEIHSACKGFGTDEK